MNKVASITGFIDEMQNNLSDQAYTSFKTALGTYKKVPCVVCWQCTRCRVLEKVEQLFMLTF